MFTENLGLSGGEDPGKLSSLLIKRSPPASLPLKG